MREAEANLALKDLKAKVTELSTMWKKHLQQRSEGSSDQHAGISSGSSASAVPSTPKKLLGSFLEGNGKSEVARLEEELMTARLVEVENEAELKASRLKVMELETQVPTLLDHEYYCSNSRAPRHYFRIKSSPINLKGKEKR